MVDYFIAGSGSKGNCIIYENIVMVDVGVPYKKIVGHINDLKYILLTHTHKDHINVATIKRLQRDLPKVVFICGLWWKSVLEDLEIGNVVYCEMNRWYKIENSMFCLVQAYHDILNCGWRIITNGQKIFHITDTVNVDGISCVGYNGIFIEFHHDEVQIEKDIEEKQNAGVFCYEIGAKNSHLSFQKAQKFIDENADENTTVVKLHISSRYKIDKQGNIDIQ